MSERVEMGRELVEILDAVGFPVTGAAWIHDPDRDEWQLFIRSPRAAEKRLDALLEIVQAADAQGDLRERLDFSKIRLVPPNDPMLGAIGRDLKISGLKAVKYGPNVVDGLYVGEAVVYRLAA